MKFFTLILLLITLDSFADEALRTKAIKHGLRSIPKDYKSLLKRLNTNEKALSKEKIALGKKLFFEKKLSLKKDLSCASCHDFKKGGADARETAIGYKNRKNPYNLNTPTILNTALSKTYFWDGSASTLYSQAKGPIQASFEMASSPTLIEDRLNKNKEYKKYFFNVYNKYAISFDMVLDAISSYEKTLLTRGRFDDFLDGNLNALDAKEKKGLNLFITKGCIGCHNGVNLGGQEMRKFPIMHHKIWSMVDTKKNNQVRSKYEDFMKLTKLTISNLDIFEHLDAKSIELLRDGYFGELDKNSIYDIMSGKGCYSCHDKENYGMSKESLQKYAYPFKNKGGFLGKDKSSQYFRTPLLRNIASTKPYFHNGGIKKLEEVVEIMLQNQMRTKLPKEDVSSIVKFLEAVDGEVVTY